MDQEALSTLIDSLNSTDGKVHFEAMHTLGEIGPGAREAIPALEEILKGEDDRVYAAAAILMSSIGA
jgi:HEAT repeat protein